MTATKPHLLPVWRTVKEAYRLAWTQRMEYLKISWFWMAVALPIIFLYSWAAWPSLSTLFCIDLSHPESLPKGDEQMHALLTLVPITAFELLVGASIAVAWHRLVLRNERITTDRYLRLDSVVWSYFAFGLFIWLLSALPNVMTAVAKNNGWAMLVTLIIQIISILLIIRLPIILPAKALGITEITVRDVWQRTSWNFWRITLGNLLCILPVAILIGFPYVFLLKAACQSGAWGGALFNILNKVIGFLLIVPIFLAFLSLSYHHFFEKDNSPPA